MTTLHAFLRAVVLTLALGSSAFGTAVEARSAGNSSCGLSAAAFCETFDGPAGIGNRSGQLNGTLWGVSRTTGDTNPGGGLFNAWAPSQVKECSGTSALQPPNDIVICNGQVREATSDNHVVTTLAMYPKQPFDFAGRTGVVSFDVSNDTQGSHSAWPEFWITDQPVPAPFTHEATWIAVPRNGVGIRFAGYVDAQGRGASCPEGSPAYAGVDSAITVSQYVPNDTGNGGNVGLHGLDCVKVSTGPGQMNHYEIHVSQNLIDVYGTDAGTTSPLKHLAQISPANLSFTRGLIWLEDVHYNASKFNTQGTHTFAWGNVGFDGPVLPRDLTFDVADALTPAANGAINLGWKQAANEAEPKTTTGVTNISDASAAMVLFNFFADTAPSAFTYVVNGQSNTAPSPYPDKLGHTWRTLAVPVPLAQVQTGTNTISIASDQAMVVSNVDLLLVGAGAGSIPPPPQEQPVTPAPPVPEPISPSTVAATTPVLPTPSHVTLTASGGDLAANQFVVRVPADVLGPSGGELNLLPLDPQSVPAQAPSLQSTNTAFVIALTDAGTGTQIARPSNALALAYRVSQAEVDQAGGDSSRLQIVNWSGDEWLPLACTNDGTGLDCAMPRLGLFALVLGPPPSDGSE